MRSPKVRSIQVQPNTRGKVAFLQLDCPVLPKVVFRFPSSGKGDTREVSVPAFEIVAPLPAAAAKLGTVRAERYGRIIRSQAKRERRERLGLPHDPLAVIVGSMDLPWDAPLFTEGGRVLIFTTDDAERPPTKSSVRVVRHEGDRVDLRAALEHLRRERGVTSLLCEGGPHLHGELLAAGLVDELFITRAPKIAGGEGPGLVAGIDESPIDAELVWLLHDPQTGDLFGRYRVAR